ncbi:peptide/nickel transport system ATP-binding protein/oligopeptide transport system ATP-binding protein [Desulfohalotomaculum tongense]|uniref:ABC transporter ATP-binding protein n=1 Tax=Desulforadius tongensis TaxID=1216062 RepID=UPI00195EDC7D|nr:ABC transporter ATP-binding protein [Desulforadius tongensis]MBM7856066.1 peptide/nickel transport system ATP-binding protein/oligopeptide transport system ATP-binding protein [Desulforadius tongensis]
MSDVLLKVENLKTHFFLDDGVVPAVDGVSFHLNRGETLAVVGESGSGKSITSLSIMRLIPNPPGRIVGGNIQFAGKNLLKLSEKEMREIRGNRISMIFQEPMTSLNPVYRVGDQISEALINHQGLKKKEAMEKAIEMLRLTGIPSPEKRAYDFPHQMSGGMRQRVMIAMALACRPELLIADEPTTALDVTIQAQILELMQELKEQLNTAIIMITHDLAVVAEMADRAVVMYCGKVVEEAPVEELFEKPLHPYTKGLLASIPRVEEEMEKLYQIEGTVPNLMHLPRGCAFAPRCPEAGSRCLGARPQLTPVSPTRKVSCWLVEGGVD